MEDKIPTIKTSRLILRPMRPQDATRLSKIFRDPVTARYWVGPDRNLRDSMDRIQRMRAHWRENGFGDWALVEKDSGRMIGYCGLHYVDGLSGVQLGYLLDRSRWGQGFATEAAEAVLRFGFERRRLHRIFAVMATRNAAAVKVAENCRMSYSKNITREGPRAVYALDRKDWSLKRRSRLASAFHRDGRGGSALISYLTAGAPTLEATGRFLAALEAAGSDVVELGVPFSDPIADGPVNQRAAEQALKSGTTLKKILSFVERYRRNGGRMPIVFFTYLNPIVRFGLEQFAEEAARAGVDGVLVVDLPPEEAGEFRRAMANAGVDTIFLASPTTSAARLRLIEKASTGFVYYVSRLGVTGARSRLDSNLGVELRALRRHVRKPIAVGFGISTPQQARAVARQADGVVVGSALVALTEDRRPKEAAKGLESFARKLAKAVKGGR